MLKKPPYFTEWAPLPSLPITTETLPNGKIQTTYRNLFEAQGDITVFQLRKSIHWVAYASNVLENAVSMSAGGFPMTGIEMPSINGFFEYSINDPSGKLIFWSRVYLCIMVVMMVESAVGSIAFSSGTVIFNPDTTKPSNSYSAAAPATGNNTNIVVPNAPILRQVEGNNSLPNNAVTIITGDLSSLGSGGKIDYYEVQRANGKELNNQTWVPDGNFVDVGKATLTGNSTSGMTLVVGLNSSINTLTVSEASSLPLQGAIMIDNEVISYSNKSGNILSGLGRGAQGTTAINHGVGSKVSDLSKIMYTYTDSTGISGGSQYFYRIKAVSNSTFSIGPAVSIYIFGKKECITLIKTYVIDSKKTSINPTLTPYDSFISYDDINKNYISKLSPGHDEETFSFGQYKSDSGLNRSWTIPGGDNVIIDGWWDGPIYEMVIPNGSILHVIHDGLSFGTFTSKGRGAEWYFRFHSEDVIWGVVKTVAGRLISSQQKSGGIAIVDSRNIDSLGALNTRKAKVIFTGSSSALVYEDDSGSIYVAATSGNSVTSFYVSTDSANNFRPLMSGDTSIKLFDGSSAYQVVDLTEDGRGITWILTLSGGNLFTGNSMDNFFQPVYVGPASSGQKYTFGEHETKPITTTEMTINGSTNGFRSSDYGRTWFFIPYIDDSDIRVKDVDYPVIDTYTDAITKLRLRKNGDSLFVQTPGMNLNNMLYVGEAQDYPDDYGQSGKNTYKLLDSPDYNTTGKVVIQGQTNSFITTNKGDTFTSVPNTEILP